GFTTGQELQYFVGASEGNAIDGLLPEGYYYAIKVDDYRIKLATPDQSDPAVTQESHLIGDTTLYVLHLGLSSPMQTIETFDPTGKTPQQENVVDLGHNTIIFNAAHSFYNGQKVTYASGGGHPIGGLTNGGTYFIITVPGAADRVQLASSQANALAG